ncbi:MAG: glycosyltransferase family 2 protein [Pseudomonadota bacterium]|nr:glycosyltransferase family 2 protein [Pseudomonadota bacterium]
MNNKLPISCFIIAQDEADRITNAIESVIDIVDEVIVIDSGSTDGTQDLARQLGCKVFFNKWKGYGPQKRFGEDCAKNEWLLNLDADEYLSDQIKSEILQIFDDNNNQYNFFSMKVTPIYPNWKRPRIFSASHECVRLYNKRFGRFSNSPVHDSVETNNSKIFYFKNHVYHNSVRSFKHLIEKEESYIQLQSKTLKDKNKIFLFLRIFVEFPLAFIKYYFIRRHFTGALTGLVTSLILAYYRWKRVIVLFKS